MRIILSLFFVVFMLMTGCSDGIDIETFDNSVSEEVLNPNTSIEFGISDNKVLSGEVIQKRMKRITLKVSVDSIIGEGTIWVKVNDENMLADINKGQKVNVWYDYIRESNPRQTTGLKIEVDSK